MNQPTERTPSSPDDADSTQRPYMVHATQHFLSLDLTVSESWKYGWHTSTSHTEGRCHLSLHRMRSAELMAYYSI
jgi:hypothetical protein